MNSNKMEVRAIFAPWWGGIEFLVCERREHGVRAVVTSMTTETIEPGHAAEPTFRLTLEQSQTVMDDLWNCGLRPTEGTGSAGSLAATERHLKDLQQLIFERDVRTKRSPLDTNPEEQR